MTSAMHADAALRHPGEERRGEEIEPAATAYLGSTFLEEGERQMAGLRKYVEWMSRGRRTERIAYVLKEWNLPKPLPGAEWQLDSKFNVADELLENPDLKEVFSEALKKGAALYTPQRSK